MSTAVGGRAEAAAAQYLVDRGFEIIARNWKTRWSEIDIIAQQGDLLYFVEVKFRLNPRFGGGLEYITKQKLERMSRAAAAWVGDRSYEGDYCLAALAMGGDPPQVEEFVALD